MNIEKVKINFEIKFEEEKDSFEFNVDMSNPTTTKIQKLIEWFPKWFDYNPPNQSKEEGILRHIVCNNPVIVSDTQIRDGNTYYRCNYCKRYGIAYKSQNQSSTTEEEK